MRVEPTHTHLRAANNIYQRAVDKAREQICESAWKVIHGKRFCFVVMHRGRISHFCRRGVWVRVLLFYFQPRQISKTARRRQLLHSSRRNLFGRWKIGLHFILDLQRLAQPLANSAKNNLYGRRTHVSQSGVHRRLTQTNIPSGYVQTAAVIPFECEPLSNLHIFPPHHVSEFELERESNDVVGNCARLPQCPQIAFGTNEKSVTMP